MTAADATAEFRHHADAIARLHQQLDAGGTVHLPSYHAAIQACERAVMTIVSARLPQRRPRPATNAASRRPISTRVPDVADQRRVRRHATPDEPPPITPAEQVRCMGKDRYPSEAAAQASLRDMRARGVRMHLAARMEPYLCIYCQEWHLGHSSKETR